MNKLKVQQLVLEPLKPSDIEQVLQLYIQSYNINDPQMQAGVLTKSDLRQHFTETLPKYIKAQTQFNINNKNSIQFNQVYKNQGKIIAVMLGIHFPKYFQLFDEEEFDLRLMNNVDWLKHQRETAIYEAGFSVHKDYMNLGIGKKIVADRMAYMSSKGIQLSYVVVSNKISLGIFMKNKSQIIYQEEQDIQNGSIKHFMIKRYLDKAIHGPIQL